MFIECLVCVHHRASCLKVSFDLILVTPPMHGWWYPSFTYKEAEAEAEAGREAHSRSHGRREKPVVCRGLWFPNAALWPPRASSRESVGLLPLGGLVFWAVSFHPALCSAHTTF